jgi:hypothetical protein
MRSSTLGCATTAALDRDKLIQRIWAISRSTGIPYLCVHSRQHTARAVGLLKNPDSIRGLVCKLEPLVCPRCRRRVAPEQNAVRGRARGVVGGRVDLHATPTTTITTTVEEESNGRLETTPRHLEVHGRLVSRQPSHHAQVRYGIGVHRDVWVFDASLRGHWCVYVSGMQCT